MRKYNTLNEFNVLVDTYFDEHAVPTFAGLARALGLSTKQLLSVGEVESMYKDKAIEAFTRIEEFAEENLYNKGASTGSKFILMNRFGWSERAEVKEDTSFTISWSDKPVDEQKLIEDTNT